MLVWWDFPMPVKALYLKLYPRQILKLPVILVSYVRKIWKYFTKSITVTTIKPNIGMISYPDFRQISIADLPGLIEGAHANYGMGHEFLRHVERTKLLLLVIDIHGFQLGHQYKYRSCLDTLVLLNKVLQFFIYFKLPDV